MRGQLFIPLLDWTGKNASAFLVLNGKKGSKSFFSEQELEIISSTIDHITLSYQVIRYNKNVRDEYAKLKKLDEAKEFWEKAKDNGGNSEVLLRKIREEKYFEE